MSMRGVRKPGARTVTSAVRGQLRDHRDASRGHEPDPRLSLTQPAARTPVTTQSASRDHDGPHSRTAIPEVHMSEVLDQARQQAQVLGKGLSYDELIAVLNLGNDSLDELLALAHEVRLAWSGDEVEVEGIVSLKTGGCPEDCHFCSQSGVFDSPVRSAWLDIPMLVRLHKRPPRPVPLSSASSLPFGVPTTG